LALALSIAPALAGGPSCCRGQGADAASSDCACCQQRAAFDQDTTDQADDEPRSCCAAKQQSCCASRAKAKSAPQLGLAVKPLSSNCCCKARPPIQAVSETQLDLRIKHDTLVTAHVDVALKPEVHESLALLRGQGEILPAPSLQRLLCRWVV
jgi:hypothetical protein